jgi:hypothetical protein
MRSKRVGDGSPLSSPSSQTVRRVLPSWIWKAVSELGGSEGLGSIFWIVGLEGGKGFGVMADAENLSVQASGPASGEVVLFLIVAKRLREQGKDWRL